MKILKLGLFITILLFVSCITDNRERSYYCYQVTYDILYPDSARRFVENTTKGRAEVCRDKNQNFYLRDDYSYDQIVKSAYPIVIIEQIKTKK